MALALHKAFERLQPQSTDHWNFADAFLRLDTLIERAKADGPGDPDPEPSSGLVRRAADRALVDRLQPMVERAARLAADEALIDVGAALDAIRDALRFLAARVENLEDVARRRARPIDGLAWLVDPVPLEPWVEATVAYLSAARLPGASILHGECGDGALAGALVRSGYSVVGVEPRGALAWEAATAGVSIEVSSVAEALGSTPSRSLGALVLSGVVDRSTVEENVGLLELVADRLTEGGSLVIIAEGTGSWPTRWSPAAQDLVAGRPLSPEAWEVLLRRHGLVDLDVLAPSRGDLGSFALAGHLP
jgi:hypothetical protein